MLVALTLISLLFILIAPWLIPLLTGDEFTPALDTLAVGLSQVLFPIVVLLGLTGLVTGIILNVHDHFTIPAIAPLVWNLVIIAGMVGLAPLFTGDDKLYAYAIGVVAGTLVQLLMMLPTLRRMGFPIGHIRLPRRGDERVKRVLLLMLPRIGPSWRLTHLERARVETNCGCPAAVPRCRTASPGRSASDCRAALRRGVGEDVLGGTSVADALRASARRFSQREAPALARGWDLAEAAGRGCPGIDPHAWARAASRTPYRHGAADAAV